MSNTDIEGSGIIFYARKHGENSLVIKIVSESDDIVTGYALGALSKNSFYKHQVGNYVHFCYCTNNENKLGTLKIELITSNSEIFFHKKESIALINLAIFIVNFFLIENNNINIVYKKLFNLIFSLKFGAEYIILYYIDFLFSIFEYLGINFNPYVCVVTNTLNTYYISPKTGNAVTKAVGNKYANRLFIIPKCFKEFIYEKNDILNALEILHFFINKFIQDNNLFYLKNDFNFLNKTLIFAVKSSNSF